MSNPNDLVVLGKPGKRPPKPRPPVGLGKDGKALWSALTARFEFEPHEVVVLTLACRQLDKAAALEELIARDGLSVTGSTGQPRLHAALRNDRCPCGGHGGVPPGRQGR